MPSSSIPREPQQVAARGWFLWLLQIVTGGKRTLITSEFHFAFALL